MASKLSLTGETKYQLLVQISQKVRDTLDLDEILNHLLDTLQTVLDFDAAGIFVLNRDFTHEHSRQPRALIAGVARRGFDAGPDERDRMLMLGEGITGYVIRAAQPVIVPDVRLDARYIAGRRSTRSQITVPLLRGERAIGALDIESDRLAAFDESDLEVLRFLADAAAISVERTALHQRLLEQQEIQQQMLTASAVQARLLPSRPPRLAGYDIAGICLPTFAIGGDYFDYIPLPDGRLGLAVADVSGEGVPAALVMSAFRALLRTQARGPSNPAQQAVAVNSLLAEFGGGDDFVTAAYAVLDPASGRLDYVNCGHPDLVLCRAGGRVERLKRGGPALNVVADLACTPGAAALAPGDLLALFTDGVFEVPDPQGDEFGLPRLIDILVSGRSAPAVDLIDRVLQATRGFSGFENYPDDFTLVIVRRLEAGFSPSQDT